MKLHLPIVSLLISACLMVPQVHAQPLKTVELEVNYLLNAIGASGCKFYRNGSWYSSVSAQAHLRDKYHYLAAGNFINTTEEFIEKAATKSSFTGLAYAVKCDGAAEVSSKQWLSEMLAHSRHK